MEFLGELSTAHECGNKQRKWSWRARRLSNIDIAAAVHITEHTVKTHVAPVLNKLDLRDRVHAVIFACEHGVIDRASVAPFD